MNKSLTSDSSNGSKPDPKTMWSPWLECDSDGHNYQSVRFAVFAGTHYVLEDQAVNGRYYVTLKRSNGKEWETIFAAEDDHAYEPIERIVKSITWSLRTFLRRKGIQLTPLLPQSGLASINQEQGLYVLQCGDGYTCLGFDVALERGTAIAEWADVPAPDAALRGTAAGYADYERCLAAGLAKYQQANERCPAELTPQLVGLEYQRVEVIDRDGERRRFQVGKSTGWMPCHLELANRRSTGGPAVMGAPFQSVRVVS